MNPQNRSGLCIQLGWLMCFAVLIASCSKKIDREDAADLLTEHYSFPYAVFQPVEMFGNVDVRHGENRITTSGILGFGKVTWGDITELIENGLVAKSPGQINLEWHHWAKPRYGPSWRYEFTELCSAYMRPGTSISVDGARQSLDAMTCEIHLKEITGLRFNEAVNEADVEYTIEYKNFTPFALFFTPRTDFVENRSAKIELYDDGWRVRGGEGKGNISVKEFRNGAAIPERAASGGGRSKAEMEAKARAYQDSLNAAARADSIRRAEQAEAARARAGGAFQQ